MIVGFDTHEIVALVDSINKASRITQVEGEKVLFKGAMNIKRDAARRIAGHPRWRRVGPSIDFDMFRSRRGPSAEIGPNHSKPQGNLGHIPEYGTLTSAPIPYMRPAAEAEQPRFERAVEDLAVKALGFQ